MDMTYSPGKSWNLKIKSQALEKSCKISDLRFYVIFWENFGNFSAFATIFVYLFDGPKVVRMPLKLMFYPGKAMEF